MDVIIIMCAGILVSKIFFPIKWKRINELLQLICTLNCCSSYARCF